MFVKIYVQLNTYQVLLIATILRAFFVYFRTRDKFCYLISVAGNLRIRRRGMNIKKGFAKKSCSHLHTSDDAFCILIPMIPEINTGLSKYQIYITAVSAISFSDFQLINSDINRILIQSSYRFFLVTIGVNKCLSITLPEIRE